MAPRKLVFATRNPHKVREVAALLGDAFVLLGLDELDFREVLPETRGTIPGNARQKAEFVFQRLGLDGFAEDTGLEVDALGGAPGADTAHYAGPERDPQANMDKLLRALRGHRDRRARFRTVIALVLHGQTHTFEGIAEGRIVERRRGTGGFGYDPIFCPDGSRLTFAQMPDAEKNSISHRARAFRKLVRFLDENPPPA